MDAGFSRSYGWAAKEGVTVLHSSAEYRLFSPDLDCLRVETRFRYCILSSPRSGSSMLCSALRATKSAGVPLEYLNPDLMTLWVKTKRPLRPEIGAYMTDIERRRTTANGVFGQKLHFNQWAKLLAPAGEAVSLGFLKSMDKLIFIVRRDKLAQAMSWTFAKQTMIFNR